MDRKIRNEKKKNTETGLLMGQNTNIFSQLSATYLQNKGHVSHEEQNFINVTQIVEYHDPKINRLISLLRKKAEVTKTKAAVELREEVVKMDEETLQIFMPTFAQLFMEIVVNQQSKQVCDQFVIMVNHLLASFKKIVIKQIATLYGPLLLINRGNNISALKTYSQLFNGTEEQLHQKGVILLVKKQVAKKFIVLCKVILECEEGNKVGQQNFQRNCSSLLKAIKDLIRSYETISGKKEQLSVAFQKIIKQVQQTCIGKHVQEYIKFGGKGKAALIQFYQCLVQVGAKHIDWGIQWEKYAKIVCQNFLDKDPVVQQTMWRFCNRQFIESCLEIEKKSQEKKQMYSIFAKFLPKPDEKLLLCMKIGGAYLYKQLPNYSTIFPFTNFTGEQTHKSCINKISFIRKLMSTILEQQDENDARIQCYYNLCNILIPALNGIQTSITALDEKKCQQIKTSAIKASKELINNLQTKFYQNPPISRNSFTYNLPTYFCKILQELEPEFDFQFDLQKTFPLYCGLKKNSEYCHKIYDTIFQNCRNKPKLELLYFQNFPTREIELDMSEENDFVEITSKIFLLSQQAKNPENWFKQNWDTRKQIIVFDPRMSLQDLNSAEESQQTGIYCFNPTIKKLPNKIYNNPQYDQMRINFFITSLQKQIQIVPFLLSFMKDEILPRHRNICVQKLLQIFMESLNKLQKKCWVVGAHEVLKIRVISDMIVETLASQKQLKVDGSKLQKFFNNICQFSLAIYNYKLDGDAEELLKLSSKLIYIDDVKGKIFQSARNSIKSAYEAFTRVGAKDSQEKQRKNRMNRLLNFVQKILWYAIDKKNKENHIRIMLDVLESNGWENADSRPDLWLLGEAVLSVMSDSAKKSLTKNIVSEYKKYQSFLSLILCCQMVLPLQRHPQAKVLFTQWQTQILRYISESCSDEQKIDILQCVIQEASQSSLHILAYGAKTMVKYLMKNYHNFSQQILVGYSKVALENPLKQFMQSQGQNFTRKCMLLMNLCSQLPLLDLPNIQTISTDLQEKSLEETGKNNLSYLAVLSCMWEAGVGIENLTNEKMEKIMKNLMNSISGMKEDNRNFIRFTAFEVLNGLYPLKNSDLWKPYWTVLQKQLIWAQSHRGSSLHGVLQSSRFKFISRVFAEADKQFKKEVARFVPEEMNQQLQLYKQILDQIEEDQDESMVTHHENIVNMFIQFAEVLMRIAGGLDSNVQPQEDMVLGLLQCPFPGIKKTSFMLLKQMYQLNLVDKQPPTCFQKYLTLDPSILTYELDATIANILSSYLYSWQAIIQRRTSIERQGLQDEQNLTLEDYLQGELLHQNFLKTVFEVLEKHLEFSKNENDFTLSAEELVEQDALLEQISIHQKIFRVSMRTLFMFILNFPMFLRDFMDRNKKYKNTCDRLLRTLISDAIFKEEVNRIEIKEPQWKADGNFQIYVTQNSKQIYAEYTHDVIRIGLRLVMRNNYPLSPITIQFGEGLKIDEGSRWALMLQSQLHNRNNTIINGILLWKQNIDKKLAGVQECAICFDVVNPTGQLPKKACKTCKKKFHSNCIMKWFTKSNKSECPLCKSQFL